MFQKCHYPKKKRATNLQNAKCLKLQASQQNVQAPLIMMLLATKSLKRNIVVENIEPSGSDNKFTGT